MTKSKIILRNQAELLQEEKERLRKLRIVQVREISKQNAAIVRDEFRKEKEKEIRSLLQRQEKSKNEEKANELREFERTLRTQVDHIGQGHLAAANYDDQTDARRHQQAAAERRAAARGRSALAAQRDQRAEHDNKENAHIVARHSALEMEKARATHVAKLPPTPAAVAQQELERLLKQQQQQHLRRSKSSSTTTTGTTVLCHDANAFTTTRYHVPDVCVDKASASATSSSTGHIADARKDALEEEKRCESLRRDEMRVGYERMEKARLRGKHALEKELLTEDYNHILGELNVLEKAEREKRQRELGKIPKDIFLPAWQRKQEKQELQMELERQFERIYVTSEMRNDEMPTPAEEVAESVSTSSQQLIDVDDTELDLTVLDETAAAVAAVTPLSCQPKTILHVDLAEQQKQESAHDLCQKSTSTASSGNVALSRLLAVIQKQRDESRQQTGASKSSSKRPLKADSKEAAAAAASAAISDDDTSVSSLCDEESSSSLSSLSDLSGVAANVQAAEASSSLSSSLGYSISSSCATSNVCSSSSSDEDEMQIENKNNNNAVAAAKGLLPRADHGLPPLATATATATAQSKAQRRLMRGIMMSSHNMSSLINGTGGGGLVRTTTSSHLEAAVAVAASVRSIGNLSHASRDPMIAGSTELQQVTTLSAAAKATNNTSSSSSSSKIAIELKQRQLHARQLELQQRLAELEQQEAALAQQEQATTVSDERLASYQRSLLLQQQQQPNAQVTLASERKSDTSSSSSSNIEAMIEERKRQLLAAQQQQQQQRRLGAVVGKQQPQFSSCDSGLSSLVTLSSTTNNNNANRNSNPAAAVTAASRTIEQQREQQHDLLRYLHGEIDEREYERRCGRSSSSRPQQQQQQTLPPATPSPTQQQQFGLELYDSNSLSDIRDSSIEKLIDWQQQQQQSHNQQQPIIALQQASKALAAKRSEDNTLNDGDDSNDYSLSLGSSNSSSGNEQGADEADDDDSVSVVSEEEEKKKTTTATNKLAAADIEHQRALIQTQLEAVRRQKEQINNQQKQQQQVSFPPMPTPHAKHLHAVHAESRNTMQHELSTIKEVDTPKSERNLKPATTNKQQLKQSTQVNTMGARFVGLADTATSSQSNNKKAHNEAAEDADGDVTIENIEDTSYCNNNTASLSLENVTELSGNSNNKPTTTNENKEEDTAKSSSQSNKSLTTTARQQTANETSASTTTTTTHSTPHLHASALHNVLQRCVKPNELFNMSLFDASSSLSLLGADSSAASAIGATTLMMLMSNASHDDTHVESDDLQKQQKKDNSSKQDEDNEAITEYGAMIFDSLSSTNLTLTRANQLTCNDDDDQDNTPRSNLLLLSSSANSLALPTSTSVNKVNASGEEETKPPKPSQSNAVAAAAETSCMRAQRKWFDILAASAASTDDDDDDDDDDGDDAERNYHNDQRDTNMSSSACKTLSQYPLNEDELEASELQTAAAAAERTLVAQATPVKPTSQLSDRDCFRDLKPVKIHANSRKDSMRKIDCETSVATSRLTTRQRQVGLNSNNNSGMFDNFLRHYASSTSVMDEPELSFVSSASSSSASSSQTNSPSSRHRHQLTNASSSISSSLSASTATLLSCKHTGITLTLTTTNNTNNASCQTPSNNNVNESYTTHTQKQHNNYVSTKSSSSSSSASNVSNGSTSGFNSFLASSNSVATLIQLQKRQLSNQFADMSPIVAMSSSASASASLLSRNAKNSISASSISSYANTLSYDTNDKS